MSELESKVQHLENKMKIKHINKENTEQKDAFKEASQIQLDTSKDIHHCDECEYNCEKKITLNKHKNTKHINVNSNNTDKSITAKNKFLCDQCNYSCQSKSSFKKHVSQKHELHDKKAFIQCDKCDKTFQNEIERKTHIEDQHCPPEENQENTCECNEELEDGVCDKCLDYWAKKSH